MGDPQLIAAEGLDETLLLNVLTDVTHGDFSVRCLLYTSPSPRDRS